METLQLLDKVPPQNLEAEQSTLGSMMIDKAALEKAVDILRPEDFYREAHEIIFDALISLAERDEAVDIITIQEELRGKNQLDTVGRVSHGAHRQRSHRSQRGVLRPHRRREGHPAPADRRLDADDKLEPRRGRRRRRDRRQVGASDIPGLPASDGSVLRSSQCARSPGVRTDGGPVQGESAGLRSVDRLPRPG